MSPEEIANDEWEKWKREPYQGATICEDARLLCERVARRIAKPRIELNEHTRAILGRPNFTCIAVANRLREMGHEIAEKSEDEQAVVICWLLNLYLEHGESWMDIGNRLLKAGQAEEAKTA